MSPWERLAAAASSRGAAASVRELDAFQAKVGYPLHPSLRRAWAEADGIELTPELRVPALADATTHRVLDLRSRNLFQVLVDDTHGNPLCVAGYPAMNGRVLRVFEDRSASRVAFRDLDGLAAALVGWLPAGGGDSRDLPAQYTPNGPRSREDIADARQLLSDAEAFFGQGNDSLGAFFTDVGCSLTNDATDLAAVLESSDEFARRTAEDRLKELGGEAAAAALRGYDDARAAFDRRCIATLEAHGVPVLRCQPGRAIRIGDVAPLWLNTPTFYNRRNEAGVMDELMARAQTLTALAIRRAAQKSKA